MNGGHLCSPDTLEIEMAETGGRGDAKSITAIVAIELLSFQGLNRSLVQIASLEFKWSMRVRIAYADLVR